MKRDRSEEFYRLIQELEPEIGGRCYNSHIQNYGPGGVWKGAGRKIRYPVTYCEKDGSKRKFSGDRPIRIIRDSPLEVEYPSLKEEIDTVHYRFGSNEIYIYHGIKAVLEKIEEKFNMDFDEILEKHDKRHG